MKDLGIMENEVVQSQLDKLDKSILHEEWVQREQAKDQQALDRLIRSNPRALHAYAKQNALDEEELKRTMNNGQFIIPAEVFTDFNK